MKFHLNISVAVMLFIASCLATDAFAQGGEGKGNGGIAVVCRNKKGKATSAQVLDLYEARNDRSLELEVPLPFGNENEIFEKMVNRLETMRGMFEREPSVSSTLYKRIAFDLKFFNRQIQANRSPLLDSRVGISLPHDFNPRVLPKDPSCHLESAVKYMENEKVVVDEEILGVMSAADRAVLWVHEALYKAARENRSVPNSDEVRIFVAQLYSLEQYCFNHSTIAESKLKWESILEKNASLFIGYPKELVEGDKIILRGEAKSATSASLSFYVPKDATPSTPSRFTISPAMQDLGFGLFISGIPTLTFNGALENVILNAKDDQKEHSEGILIQKKVCSQPDQRVFIHATDEYGTFEGFKDMKNISKTQVWIKLREW